MFPVVDCGDPGTVDHATKAGSIYIYNNVVTYTCNTGYEMSGSASITCQASGFWSDNQPICTSKMLQEFYLHNFATIVCNNDFAIIVSQHRTWDTSSM